jgi:hypothetical protein
MVCAHLVPSISTRSYLPFFFSKFALVSQLFPVFDLKVFLNSLCTRGTYIKNEHRCGCSISRMQTFFHSTHKLMLTTAFNVTHTDNMQLDTMHKSVLCSAHQCTSKLVLSLLAVVVILQRFGNVWTNREHRDIRTNKYLCTFEGHRSIFLCRAFHTNAAPPCSNEAARSVPQKLDLIELVVVLGNVCLNTKHRLVSWMHKRTCAVLEGPKVH